MVEAKDIIEIRLGDGKRYIQYPCDSCEVEHIVRVDAGCFARLKRALKVSDMVLLWCGRGVLPSCDDDGLTVKMVPRCRMEKRELKKLQEVTRTLEMSVRHGINMDSDSKDLIAIAEEKIDAIEKDKDMLEQQQRNIRFNIQKLKECDA